MNKPIVNTTLDMSFENEQYLTECRTRDVDKRPFGYYEGVQYLFSFPNGYGASVLKNYGSYGYENDEWEMALLNSNGDLVYIRDFEVDVVGWISDEEVNELLTKISEYPREGEEEDND